MNKANWTIEEEIKKRVEKEAWFDWSQKPDAKIEFDYSPQKFQLSETAKHVFGSAIHFVKTLPKI